MRSRAEASSCPHVSPHAGDPLVQLGAHWKEYTHGRKIPSGAQEPGVWAACPALESTFGPQPVKDSKRHSHSFTKFQPLFKETDSLAGVLQKTQSQ